MEHLVIASQNPVKVQATLEGFHRMFPETEFGFSSVLVPSGVNDQPRSDAEALQGAANRAGNARRAAPEADYWIGIEGGVQELGVEMAAFAWIVVLGKDLQGKGRTGAFFLPEAIASLVRQGKELGEADDIVFNRANSKQENGAIGILTGDVLDRAAFYQQAVILALVPFKNRNLYV